VPGESHGIREFLEGCEAALMGPKTFEPALRTERGRGRHSTCLCSPGTGRRERPTTS